MKKIAIIILIVWILLTIATISQAPKFGDNIGIIILAQVIGIIFLIIWVMKTIRTKR